MTERNDAHTPLSRMRFSWQRRDGLAEETDEPAEVPSDPGEAPVAAGVPFASEWSVPAEVADTETQQRWADVSAGWTPATQDTALSVPPPTYDEPSRLAPSEPEPDTAGAEERDAEPEPPPAAPRARTEPRRRADGEFDVPPPGGPFRGKRGLHVGVRSVLVITCALVLLGTVGVGAYVYGAAAAGEATYSLSEDDIAAYGLTEYPEEQAAQFAADYVRICLNYPERDADKEQRQDQLAQYTSDGVDQTCGWNGTGVQTVLDVTWTGESEPVTGADYGGHARWFTFRALTSSGTHIVEVPVYVDNLTTGHGFRIVGDLGELPQPTLADIDRPARDDATDDALADALIEGEFFVQFFAAWGESDSAALQRLVSPDARSSARSGLDQALTEPTIQDAKVFYPQGVEASDDEFTWDVGATTEVWVWVTWQSPRVGDGATATRAYRLQLVKTADASSPTQQWAVRDIRGGVPDVAD